MVTINSVRSNAAFQRDKPSDEYILELRIHEYTELGDNNSIKKDSMGGKVVEKCSRS
jgi:hypothetical protein